MGTVTGGFPPLYISRNLNTNHQGALMNDYDVVAKISIVPRGPAGGVTIFMPSEERLNSGLYSKELLWNQRKLNFESVFQSSSESRIFMKICWQK